MLMLAVRYSKSTLVNWNIYRFGVVEISARLDVTAFRAYLGNVIWRNCLQHKSLQ